jgi:hypothetical protein
MGFLRLFSQTLPLVAAERQPIQGDHLFVDACAGNLPQPGLQDVQF